LKTIKHAAINLSNIRLPGLDRHISLIRLLARKRKKREKEQWQKKKKLRISVGVTLEREISSQEFTFFWWWVASESLVNLIN
jgi:hypothetical protein